MMLNKSFPFQINSNYDWKAFDQFLVVMGLVWVPPQLSLVCVCVWKISPKNTNFFPFGQKKSLPGRVKGGSASFLLRVKSMLR